MPPENTINPYLPPSQSPAQEKPGSEPGPLKDPRALGWTSSSLILSGVLATLAQALLLSKPHYYLPTEIFKVLFTVAGLVVYLFWIHRCAANARTISRDGENYSSGWAVGSYFIPFVNLVAPCLVMLEVTRKTFAHRPHAGMKGIVIAWWLCYLFRGLSLNLEEIVSQAFMSWISLSFNLLAALLIAYIIMRVSVAQAEFSWDDVSEYQRPRMIAVGSTPRQIHPPMAARVPAKIPLRRPTPPPARKIAPADPNSGEEAG